MKALPYEQAEDHLAEAVFIILTNPLDTMAYLAMKTAKVEPHRVVGQAGILDSARMRAFVGKEIAQLVSLAFATGGIDAGGLSQRLADKLMTDETAKTLDPLRETLRLTDEVTLRTREGQTSLARVGGDDFTLIFEELDHPEDAATRRLLGKAKG